MSDRNKSGGPAPPLAGLPDIVVVAGPTATGKTALAIELALRFGGEVVNADSRYLYRGFDIGVAKPSLAERRGVPHHLIDILPPDGDMSLARFQDLAFAAIDDINARGRLPILAGGTPLYVNAVVENWRIPRVPPNPGFRAELEAEAARSGIAPLAERLRAADPVTAARSGNNLRRIIRALEIHDATGSPMSELEGKGDPRWRALELGLFRDRSLLYPAIDRRIADQIGQGLVDEIRGLLASGVPETAPAMASIGYRQLLPFIRGDQALAEGIAAIAADTRRYVRHQETWLRRNSRLIRLDPDAGPWPERPAALAGTVLRSGGTRSG
ncbi:MAG: tRNA (adenosine(37)-N6)-dimethylallyltransferase MiaA [Chloroflexota bacterium]